MSKLQPWISVKVLVERDGRILCVKKREFPFSWELPGGCMDEDDYAPALTVQRELEEELGWKVSGAGRLVDVERADPLEPFADVMVLVYEIDDPGQAIVLSDEHERLAWLTRDEILALVDEDTFNPGLGRLLYRAWMSGVITAGAGV